MDGGILLREIMFVYVKMRGLGSSEVHANSAISVNIILVFASFSI